MLFSDELVFGIWAFIMLFLPASQLFGPPARWKDDERFIEHPVNKEHKVYERLEDE